MLKKVWLGLIAGAASLMLLGAGCAATTSLQGTVENNQGQSGSASSSAEATGGISSLVATDQTVNAGTVTIGSVHSTVDGWVAIHQDLNGKPGLIIGAAVVKKGDNSNVVVTVKTSSITPKLYAMLHEDKGVIGQFEFSSVDTVVMENGSAVMQAFTVTVPSVGLEGNVKVDANVKVVEKVEANVSASAQVGAQMETKVVKLFAKSWAFEPKVITIKKGQKVQLEITSVDVTHGFSLPDFNVQVSLEPNQTQIVEFTPDKTGSFPFRCSVYCGDGHALMTGTVVVTE